MDILFLCLGTPLFYKCPLFQSPTEGPDEEGAAATAAATAFFGAPQPSVSRAQIEREQRMLEERLRAQQIEVL